MTDNLDVMKEWDARQTIKESFVNANSFSTALYQRVLDHCCNTESAEHIDTILHDGADHQEIVWKVLDNLLNELIRRDKFKLAEDYLKEGDFRYHLSIEYFYVWKVIKTGNEGIFNMLANRGLVNCYDLIQRIVKNSELEEARLLRNIKDLKEELYENGADGRKLDAIRSILDED